MVTFYDLRAMARALVFAVVFAAWTAGCAPRSARAVRGTWEIAPSGGGRFVFRGTIDSHTGFPNWIILREGRTPGSVEMTRPTGIGCQDESGTFANGRAIITFPIPQGAEWRIDFQSSRRAVLTWKDDATSERVLLQRINRVIGIFCE